jgi:hypothetical protein
MNDLNPYTPPSAESRETVRTRWRVIPVTVLLVFGVATVLSGMIKVVVTDAVSTPQLTVACALALAGGLAWVLAGIAFWAGRWRLGGGMALCGFLFAWASGIR